MLLSPELQGVNADDDKQDKDDGKARDRDGKNEAGEKRGKANDNSKDERSGGEKSTGRKSGQENTSDNSSSQQPSSQQPSSQQEPPAVSIPPTVVSEPLFPVYEGITISEPRDENLIIEESVSSETHFERSISDNVAAEDLYESTIAAVSIAQRPIEEPILTTLDVPFAPITPDISVVSAGVIRLNDQEAAVIAFQSSTIGEYLIEIRDASDTTVQNIAGELAAGTNYASWDGRNSFGSRVNEGEYSYYITAQNVGIRSPPAEGDGSIVVNWPIWVTGPAFMLQNLLFIYIGILVVLGALIAYFLLHRGKLTLYVPVAATDIVSDVLAKHHDAKVEDYVDLTENASRYKGITIANAKGIDQEWLKGIVSRTKAASGVKTLVLDYGGKRVSM